MSYIHVWPDRYPDRWDGGSQVENLTAFLRVPFRDALTKRYTTDAHFSPAMLGDQESFPPMKKKGFPQHYMDMVRYHVLVVDLDAPDEMVDGEMVKHHRTPEWEAKQLELLRDTPWDGAIKYVTKGGYRLVWELPEFLTIKQYEITLKAVCSALRRIGMNPDPLFDWVRCFRLPFVVRKDERTNFKAEAQEFSYYDSENPILPLAFLDLKAEVTATQVSLGTLIENTQLPLSLNSSAATGRNNFLYRIGCSLRNLAWIDEELMADFLNRVNERKFELDPLDFDEIQGIASKVCSQHEVQEGTDLETVIEEPLPVIKIQGGELDVHVREAIASLVRAENLYVRGGKLARLTPEEIEVLPKDALCTLMCENAEYQRAKPRKDGGFDMISIDPPNKLVDCVYVAGHFPGIRELEQIVTFPTLRPDGSMLEHSGYDEQTRAYLRPTVEVPSVPDVVSEEMAGDALTRIKLLFQDFPFAERCHESAAIAAIMTPVLRLAITGPTPLFIFDSTTPGSGKSLLADIVSIIATGEDAARRPQTDDTEMRKEITADLLAGTLVILIDNVDRPLGGPALDAALTSINWTGRELSRTKMLKLKNITTWLATGNNIVVKGDLSRRSMRIYLDPGMERPEERNKFRIPKLLEYVRENRAQLIHDILVLARGRQQSGFSGVSAFGSFESWSYWVRETLIWCGQADPLDSQKPLREGSSVSTWGQILFNLFHVFNTKKLATSTEEFTAKQVHDCVFDNIGPGSADHKAVLSSGYQELTDDQSVRKTTDILRRWSNRVVGGFKLVANNDERRKALKGVTYRVERIDVPNLQVVPNTKIG